MDSKVALKVSKTMEVSDLFNHGETILQGYRNEIARKSQEIKKLKEELSAKKENSNSTDHCQNCDDLRGALEEFQETLERDFSIEGLKSYVCDRNKLTDTLEETKLKLTSARNEVFTLKKEIRDLKSRVGCVEDRSPAFPKLYLNACQKSLKTACSSLATVTADNFEEMKTFVADLCGYFDQLLNHCLKCCRDEPDSGIEESDSEKSEKKPKRKCKKCAVEKRRYGSLHSVLRRLVQALVTYEDMTQQLKITNPGELLWGQTFSDVVDMIADAEDPRCEQFFLKIPKMWDDVMVPRLNCIRERVRKRKGKASATDSSAEESSSPAKRMRTNSVATDASSEVGFPPERPNPAMVEADHARVAPQGQTPPAGCSRSSTPESDASTIIADTVDASPWACDMETGPTVEGDAPPNGVDSQATPSVTDTDPSKNPYRIQPEVLKRFQANSTQIRENIGDAASSSSSCSKRLTGQDKMVLTATVPEERAILRTRKTYDEVDAAVTPPPAPVVAPCSTSFQTHNKGNLSTSKKPDIGIVSPPQSQHQRASQVQAKKQIPPVEIQGEGRVIEGQGQGQGRVTGGQGRITGGKGQVTGDQGLVRGGQDQGPSLSLSTAQRLSIIKSAESKLLQTFKNLGKNKFSELDQNNAEEANLRLQWERLQMHKQILMSGKSQQGTTPSSGDQAQSMVQPSIPVSQKMPATNFSCQSMAENAPRTSQMIPTSVGGQGQSRIGQHSPQTESQVPSCDEAQNYSGQVTSQRITTTPVGIGQGQSGTGQRSPQIDGRAPSLDEVQKYSNQVRPISQRVTTTPVGIGQGQSGTGQRSPQIEGRAPSLDGVQNYSGQVISQRITTTPVGIGQGQSGTGQRSPQIENRAPSFLDEFKKYSGQVISQRVTTTPVGIGQGQSGTGQRSPQIEGRAPSLDGVQNYSGQVISQRLATTPVGIGQGQSGVGQRSPQIEGRAPSLDGVQNYSGQVISQRLTTTPVGIGQGHSGTGQRSPQIEGRAPSFLDEVQKYSTTTPVGIGQGQSGTWQRSSPTVTQCSDVQQKNPRMFEILGPPIPVGQCFAPTSTQLADTLQKCSGQPRLQALQQGSGNTWRNPLPYPPPTLPPSGFPTPSYPIWLHQMQPLYPQGQGTQLIPPPPPYNSGTGKLP